MIKIRCESIFILFTPILFTQLLFAGMNYSESGAQTSGQAIEKLGTPQEPPEQDKKHYTSYRVTKRIKLMPSADLYSLQCKSPLIRNDFSGQVSKKITVSPNYNVLVKDPDQNDIAWFYFSNVKSGQVLDLVMIYDVAIQDSDFFVSPYEAGETGRLNEDI